MTVAYSDDQKKIISSIRNSLTDLLSRASQINNIQPEQIKMLKEALKMLEDLFMVVAVGEFNAGKSSFINALLNTDTLAEGVTPTTAKIHFVRYGKTQQIQNVEDWGLIVSLPATLLQAMSFVDTPGTNTVLEDHEALTKWFFPRADMVLFLTSADRPFSESERRLLSDICDWGKKIVIILNKIDLFQNKEDLNRVIEFVRENAEKLLKTDVPILPVSSRLAKEARNEISTEKWIQSGFAALETYFQEKIDEESRFAAKMNSALNIGLKISGECLDSLYREKQFFQEDKALSDSIQMQLDLYQSDMELEIERSMREVSAVFLEIKQRGNDYFDELFRVKNLPDLLKKDKNQISFQENVLQTLPTEVERKTTELVEIISIQQQRMIHATILQIENRKTQFSGSSISAQSQNTRSTLLQKMQNAIDQMLSKVEQNIAMDIGMKHAQTAVTTALAIEVSAIGIGTALTMIATTVATDILGVIAAFWVGVAGLFVLPHYRKKAKQEFSQKMDEIKKKLIDSLSNEFKNEISSQVREIDLAVSPFRNFTRSSINLADENIQQISVIGDALEAEKQSLP